VRLSLRRRARCYLFTSGSGFALGVHEELPGGFLWSYEHSALREGVGWGYFGFENLDFGDLEFGSLFY
jgi:hypothetical protein